MANEITLYSRLVIDKESAGIGDTLPSPAGPFTMTGNERLSTSIFEVGTSEEALPLGDVGTIGWCYLENLDVTNFVTLRMATGHTVGLKFPPGVGYPFYLNATAPFAKADTAACRVKWGVYEA